MYKMWQKLTATMLVTIIILAEFSLIGIYGGKVRAEELNSVNETQSQGQVDETGFESQNTKVQNAEMNFDAYFVENQNKIHQASEMIEGENSLTISFNLTSGYVKSGTISFIPDDDEKVEFNLKDQIQDELVQSVNKDTNTIVLNKVNTSKTIEVPFEFKYAEEILANGFSGIIKAKFNGVYVNQNGQEVNVNKEILLFLVWKADIENKGKLVESISKFIPYSVAEQEGVLVQETIKAYVDTNPLPVKSTKIEIDVPTINNIKPTSIKVIANTNATNGDIEGTKFTQNNYEYNEELNKLYIEVNNSVKQNGKVTWKKGAADEYKVIYTYPKTAKQAVDNGNVTLTRNVKSEISMYSAGTNTKCTNTYQKAENFRTAVGKIVDLSADYGNKTISKGQLYTNFEVEESKQKEVTYVQNWNVEVSETSLVDEIVVKTAEEDLVKNNNSTYSTLTVQDIYYKKLTVSKNEILNVLGNEPQISIYNGETLIATINKDSIDEDKDMVTTDLSSFNINGITIKTSKPVKEGNLNFIVEKAIKKQTSKTKAEIAAISKFVTTLRLSLFNGETKILEEDSQSEISLVEPESSATISIDRENFSTVIPNNDVKFTVILNTNNELNRLYKNPVVYIQLPKEVTDVQLKDVKLLFDDELTIVNSNVTTTDNHNKMIVITLSGAQTSYNLDSLTGGANIVVTADVIVDKQTANSNSQITLTYKNENEDNLLRYEFVDINFVAPVGIIAVSSIDNYVKDKEKLITLSGNDITAEIERNAPERTVKFSMSVINNYNYSVSDVKILGRVPSQTFDMALQNRIIVNISSGIAGNSATVYYSLNKDADKDLTKESNGWTSTIDDYTKVKSYLIVVDGEFTSSSCVDFEYLARLPEKLDYNQTAIENYTVYFNNHMDDGVIADSVLSPKITITTGLGPKLEADLVSSIDENTIVPTGNIVKYTATVKNIGTKEATEVKAIIAVPENTSYVDYSEENSSYRVVNTENGLIEIDFGTIEKNQVVAKDFYLKINEKPGEIDEFTIETKVEFTAKELDSSLYTNSVRNKSINSVFILGLNNGNEDTSKSLTEGDELKLLFTVKTKDPLVESLNTILEVRIPEGLQYKSVDAKLIAFYEKDNEEKQVEANYNQNTRLLTINLGNVINSKETYVYINTIIDNLVNNEYSKTISVSGIVKTNSLKTVELDTEKIVSRDVSETVMEKEFEIVKEGLEVIQSANIPSGSKISYGENLLFTIRLKNIGGKDLLVNIKDELPEELKVLNYSYISEGKEVKKFNTKNNTVEENDLIVRKGSETIVKINAIAQEVNKDTVVKNVLEASTLKLSNIRSNEITYTIEKIKYQDEDPTDPSDPIDPSDPTDPTDPEDPTDPSGDKKAYVKLSGLVWKDQNKDGVKGNSEELLEGIEVALFNVKTNKLYEKDGEVLRVRTDDKGIYLFENIPSGKYMVVFMYDTSKYSATLYQNEKADEYTNSDAVDKKIKLNGKETVVAITDIITLTDKNKYNIDLGLVDNPKFDLSLSMKISKVTVQSKEGTKAYDYDTTLAKVEFPEKTLNGSTIVVEYTITVKNEGMVEGYVKKIADYLPTGLSFNSELNRDWYENENGIVYNASLANTKIMPGETKEVKLYLSKVINENSLGTINNNAEIYEAYNDEALEDIDSTPDNKNTSEDDYSSCDLVLSIKTGKVVVFIGLTLTIITIIGVGAYFIKKKVLR